MAFPANPALNDQYVIGTKTWEYDGTTWTFVGSTNTNVDLTNYYTKTEVDGLIPTIETVEITGGQFQTPAASGTSNISLGSNVANRQIFIYGFNFHQSQELTADTSGVITVSHGSSSDPETWYWVAVDKT